MTEWNAAEYARRSGLQEAMAEEVLALLDLGGSERVLDVGCGDGRITAEVAARVPQGAVVGVDPTFVTDVLDRYASVAADRPGEENTFKFYQMDITLARGEGVRTSVEGGG